jgi:hypothetical protein
MASKLESKEVKETKITKQIQINKLEEVLQAMRNNSKKVLRKFEEKINLENGYSSRASEFSFEFDPKVVALGKSMLGTNEYVFRLVRNATLTSGAGAVNIDIPTSLDTYLESASMVALFDECKMMKNQFEFVVTNLITGTTAFDVVIGFRNSQDGIAPTASSVSRLPNSQIYNLYPGSYPLRSIKQQATGLFKQRAWGLTTADTITASNTITQGCLGQWEISGLGATTPPTTIKFLSYRTIAVAKFRCRT